MRAASAVAAEKSERRHKLTRSCLSCGTVFALILLCV